MKSLNSNKIKFPRVHEIKFLLQSITANINLSIHKTSTSPEKHGLAVTYRRFAFLATSILSVSASIYLSRPAQAQSTKINSQFREAIYKGCLKTAGNSKELCSCYSTRISSRYNSTQAIAIYRMSRSSDDARKMFFLAHSPEYAICKQQT